MITETKEQPNNYYKIMDIDLSRERKIEDQNLQRVYTELSVLRSPSAFSIILNDKNNDKIPVAANQTISITDFEITEIWIKNTAAAGTAYLWLATRED